MVYVVLLLLVLTLFLLLKNFRSRSVYFLLAMMVGLELAIWIGVYLVIPILLLLRWCRKSTVPIKRMQYLTMAGCLAALDGLYAALLLKGPFKVVYFMSNDHLLLGHSSKMEIPGAYYTMLPVLALIMVAVTITLLVKYRGVDTADFIKQHFLAKISTR